MASSHNLFLILFLSSFLFTSQALTWTSITSLHDLESTSDAAFSLEANTWTCSNCPGPKYYDCIGAFVLGGYASWAGISASSYGDYFQKTYTGLPSHNQVNISMTIYAIDSWDSPGILDNFAVQIDGTTFPGWELVIFHLSTPLTDFCGSGFTDFPPFTMYIYMPHTSSSLTIKLITLLDESTSNESLGMRDLILTFVELTSPEQRSCGISSLSLPYNACPCPQTNQYMDPPVTGICHPCHTSCATCDGPAANDCFSCYPGWYLVGSQCFPCNGNCETCIGTATTCTSCVPGRYLAHSKCFPTCFFPLYSSIDANYITWCNTPCPSSVAYWDGTCHSSCISAFIMKDYGAYFVCVPNCAAGSYVSPDGTCIPVCNPKYSYPVMRVGVWFCGYRCPAPNYLFLPDGSCVLTCPFGTTKDDTTRSCQPCQDSLFEVCPVVTVCTTCVSGAILDIGSSGLCQICTAMITDYDRPVGANSHQYLVNFAPKGCELSLSTVQAKLKPTENSKKRLPEFTYTIKETPGKKNYFYVILDFKNSVLKDSELDVTLEYLSGTLDIPKTLVSSGDWDGASSMTQIALKVAAAVGIGSTAVLSKTGPVWSMINFQQFIGYFIYINVEYPANVEFLLSLFTFTDWSFLPNPFMSILRPIINKVEALQRAEVSDKYLPPMKFVRYGMTAFFIENSMGVMIINVALHLFLLLIRTLKGLSSKLNGEKIVNWVYVRLRWTIVFRNFLETAIPLALATFLQIRKMTLETSASTASVMSALFSFGCLAGTLFLMLGILEERSPSHLTKRKVRRIHGALYEGIDLNNCIAKYYNLLILLRGLVLIFLISFVNIEPIIQIIPLIIFNVGLVVYSAMKIVFEDKYLNKINLLKEIAILIAEIGILFLYLNFGGEMYNKILGWMIFCPLAFAAAVEIIYVFLGIFLEVIKLLKTGYLWMNKKLNHNQKILEEKKLNNNAVKMNHKMMNNNSEIQALPPTQQPFDFRSRETHNTHNEIYQQRVQRARTMRVKRGPPIINNNNNNNNNQWNGWNQQVKPNQMQQQQQQQPKPQPQPQNQMGMGGFNNNNNFNNNMNNPQMQMQKQMQMQQQNQGWNNQGGWNNQNKMQMNNNMNGWNQNMQMQNPNMMNNMNRMQNFNSSNGGMNQMNNFNTNQNMGGGFQNNNNVQSNNQNTTTVTNNLLDLADTKPVRLDTASGIMSLYGKK